MPVTFLVLSSILFLENIWFKKNSFYCGDAAGRKNDFSDSDKNFAKNIGIEFYIPEKIFMWIYNV